jgi:hypothetical protein
MRLKSMTLLLSLCALSFWACETSYEEVQEIDPLAELPGDSVIESGVTQTLQSLDTLKSVGDSLWVLIKDYAVIEGQDTAVVRVDTVWINKKSSSSVMSSSRQALSSSAQSKGLWFRNEFGRRVELELWTGKNLSYVSGTVKGVELQKVQSLESFAPVDSTGPVWIPWNRKNELLAVAGVKLQNEVQLLSLRIWSLGLGDTLVLNQFGDWSQR